MRKITRVLMRKRKTIRETLEEYCNKQWMKKQKQIAGKRFKKAVGAIKTAMQLQTSPKKSGRPLPKAA